MFLRHTFPIDSSPSIPILIFNGLTERDYPVICRKKVCWCHYVSQGLLLPSQFEVGFCDVKFAEVNHSCLTDILPQSSKTVLDLQGCGIETSLKMNIEGILCLEKKIIKA